MKSKKILISVILFLIFIFGTLFSIIGLIIYTNKSTKLDNSKKYTRYLLKNKIKKDNIIDGIINSFIDKNKTKNANKIQFYENDNLVEPELFFKQYLKTIFNLNETYETKLSIHNLDFQEYNISFSILWYFEHKGTHLIYKNNKYYDVLKFIYKGIKNESKNC